MQGTSNYDPTGLVTGQKPHSPMGACNAHVYQSLDPQVLAEGECG